MRFNSKELSIIACQPRERFDKEGVLLIKEKQEGLFRKGEGMEAYNKLIIINCIFINVILQ